MKEPLRGMGRVFRRGRVYWIAFYHRGNEIRESSGSEKEADARKLLKRRIAETQTGCFVVDEEKVTFEDLAEGITTDYRLNGRRSIKSALENNLKHLRGFFGFDRAIDIPQPIPSISTAKNRAGRVRGDRQPRVRDASADVFHSRGCRETLAPPTLQNARR